MSFALPLLPTIPDDLQEIRSRQALLYQNSFMKNALIRALNNIHIGAAKINSSNTVFQAYMKYVEVICGLITLHIDGDDMFFKSVAKECPGYRAVVSKSVAPLKAGLASLKKLTEEWSKDPDSYSHLHLQNALNSLEPYVHEVFIKEIHKFAESALPKTLSDDKLDKLIKENMMWLSTNGDITILVPFCIAHHDPKTSNHWPPVAEDAIQMIPEIAKLHQHLWDFAPFEPVIKDRK